MLSSASLLFATLTGGVASAQTPGDMSGDVPQGRLTDLVRVTGGLVRGNDTGDGMKSYLGIPYAAPPVGPLRWRPPVPAESWEGERDGRTFGPECVQPESLSDFYRAPHSPMSEDCLYLNVWTKADRKDERLPVMVWIHGGALVEGSGNRYPGEGLANKGVVIVTLNYRLGPFGFFAHPELTEENGGNSSGNQGFLDQIEALRWVQDNISEFGGDPENVTIFGESAGSWSASVLQASPLARGLFHKVIGQSGSRFLPQWHRSKATGYAPSAESWGQQIAGKIAGVEAPGLEDIRAIPAEHIMDVYVKDPELLMNFDALAIVDGEVLPDPVADIFARGEQADVPVLIGSNQDEATTFSMELHDQEYASTLDFKALFLDVAPLFLPEVSEQLPALYPLETPSGARQSYFDLQTDVQFTQPMREWANNMATVSSPVFVYWWRWAPPLKGNRELGAFHAADVPYVFGMIGNESIFSGGIDDTPEERAFSDLIMTIWTNFAKTGDPSVAHMFDWPEYHQEEQKMFVLGTELYVEEGIRRKRTDAISEAFAERRGT